MSGDGRRVLIVVQNLPVPFDRRVWLEATTLTREGYTVTVICPKSRLQHGHEMLEEVEIFRYPLPIDAQANRLRAGVRLVLPHDRVSRAWWWRSAGAASTSCTPAIRRRLTGCWAGSGASSASVSLRSSRPLAGNVSRRNSAPGQCGGRRHPVKALLCLERRTFRRRRSSSPPTESQADRDRARRQATGAMSTSCARAPARRFKVHASRSRLAQGQADLLVYLGEICKQDGVDHLIRAS